MEPLRLWPDLTTFVARKEMVPCWWQTSGKMGNYGWQRLVNRQAEGSGRGDLRPAGIKLEDWVWLHTKARTVEIQPSWNAGEDPPISIPFRAVAGDANGRTGRLLREFDNRVVPITWEMDMTWECFDIVDIPGQALLVKWWFNLDGNFQNPLDLWSERVDGDDLTLWPQQFLSVSGGTGRVPSGPVNGESRIPVHLAACNSYWMLYDLDSEDRLVDRGNVRFARAVRGAEQTLFEVGIKEYVPAEVGTLPDEQPTPFTFILRE